MHRVPSRIFLNPLKETFSEPYQITKIKRFAKIANGWKESKLFLQNLNLRCLTEFWTHLWLTRYFFKLSFKILLIFLSLVDQAKATFQNLKKNVFLFRVRHDIKKASKFRFYYNVNLMTDIFKIIVKYRQISLFLLPSGNRALAVILCIQNVVYFACLTET